MTMTDVLLADDQHKVPSAKVARTSRRDGVTIRLANSIDDLDALVPLVRAMHAESDDRRYPLALQRLFALGEKALKEPGNHGLILAERDGLPIGFLFAVVNRFFFSDALTAGAMAWFVAREHRGGLAAVKLLHAYRNWARNRKAAQIQIFVTTGSNLARTDRLMRRLGFRQSGGNYAMSI